VLRDLLGSLLLSCRQSLERFFKICHGFILMSVVMELKLSSIEDVGEGGRQLQKPVRPTASAPGIS
jgi:hypothetical protein